MLGQTPGSLLEIVTMDAQGRQDGTALLQVAGRHGSDAHGGFVEVSFVGGSNSTQNARLAPLFASAGCAVLHLCHLPASQCQALAHWPGRVVLHADTARERTVNSLVEPWVPLSI